MKQFIDIHSHILYSVDDGARSRDESMRMVQMAHDNGTKNIILTPHYHPIRHYVDLKLQREIYQEFKEFLKIYSDICIYDGNEIYYTHETITMLENKKLVTLADSRYVLVEFSTDTEYSCIENAVHTLQMSGYWCIIAHVERYSCLRKIERVEELVRRGAFIQVNSNSVGKSILTRNGRYVRQLLENELIHFIASDAHDLEMRSPDMTFCYEWICKHYDGNYAKRLMYENAMYILQKERL